MGGGRGGECSLPCAGGWVGNGVGAAGDASDRGQQEGGGDPQTAWSGVARLGYALRMCGRCLECFPAACAQALQGFRNITFA